MAYKGAPQGALANTNSGGVCRNAAAQAKHVERIRSTQNNSQLGGGVEEELQKENATLRKKVDVLQSELNNMKHACESLKRQLSSLNNAKDGKQRAAEPTKTGMQSQKVAELTNKIGQWNEHYQILENNTRADARKHAKQEQILNQSINTLKQENRELRDRNEGLAITVGESLHAATQQNSTQSENINDKCRPSLIAEKYHTLSFQKTSQIRSKMSAGCDTKEKQIRQELSSQYICNIYMTAGEHIMKMYHKLISNLEWALSCLSHPISLYLPNVEESKTEPKAYQIPPDIQRYVRKTLLSTGSDTDVKGIVKEILQEVKATIESKNKGRDAETHFKEWYKTLSDNIHIISNFAEDVCKIAWEMAIQTPPMRWEISGIGEKPDEKHQSVLPMSRHNGKDMHIDRMIVTGYLEPTLIHGGKALVAGRVNVTMAQNTK